MALSSKAKKAMENAMADKGLGDEIVTALQASVASPAGDVAAIGATTNLPAANSVLSTSNTYTDAAVKTAINGAVDALRVPAEARLDAIEAKIDAILSSLKAAGLMA